MKIVLLLSVASICAGFSILDTRIVPETRIAGGYGIDIAKHGHHISLRKKSIFKPHEPYTHICGGSIYLKNIVLTAAHCVIATVPSELKVVAGANVKDGSDGVLVAVKDIIMHENFSPYTFNNDVAVLILAVPLPLNNFTIRPIKLIDDTPAAGTLATIIGWGDLSEAGSISDILREARITVISHDECNEIYNGYVTDLMLCAGSKNQGIKDACSGDSGGPLIVNNELAGIISWGNGCGRSDFPGVYANVAALRSWILEKTAHMQ